MFQQSQFTPAWWLKNPHLQTLSAKWLKRKQHINTITETIELPDGDFIDIDWTEKPSANNTKPIVVVLHGLEGSKESHYAKGILSAIQAKGWIGLLMHFRGCSGRPNRHISSYHSGDTRDIRYLSSLLKQRYQACTFGLIGYSLGGNVAVKYLVSLEENSQHIYQCAAVICAPLHLSSCSDRINRGFSKVYQNYLVTMLKQHALEKLQSHKISHLNTKKLSAIKTLREFDQHVTAPLNNFLDAEDYYQKASGRDDLAKISLPCLIIHAQDDPFLSHTDITDIDTLPDNIEFEVSQFGGHVGFIGSNQFAKPYFWLEQKIPDYLQDYL